MRDVYVIGGGLTHFGELWERSLRDLFVEAGLAALRDGGVDRLDGMYIGCMSGGLFVEQEHLSSLLADWLGVSPVPAVRVESACASGGMAFRSAYFEVASGASEVVLAGGVEKMTDGADVTRALATASDQEYEAYQGVTFPGLYAMMARAHMHQYRTTRKEIASVAVKNHDNALLNPRAQLRSRNHHRAGFVVGQGGRSAALLDCSPVSDGAAAVVLASEEYARKSKRPLGEDSGWARHRHDRAHLAQATWPSLDVVANAAAKAYAMSRRGPSEVKLAEIRHSFTIAEIMAIEALGLVEKGRGGASAQAGETARDGRIPVNTSGGSKPKATPWGRPVWRRSARS